MIPIRDQNPTRSTPVLIWCLVAANLAVFFFELYLEFRVGHGVLRAFMYAYGAVPARLAHGVGWLTAFSSMFLHGGFLHVLGNMWFLWVFGDNIEDVLGNVRFLLFYFLCGLVAVIAQVWIDPTATVPMVGASGAIAGVLGAYVVLFPKARVVTLFPIFIFLQFVELPAFLFIFVWFGLQLLNGWMSLDAIGSNTGGTAFFAHIGGFIAGIVLIRVLGRAGETKSAQGRRVSYRPKA